MYKDKAECKRNVVGICYEYNNMVESCTDFL